jgi:UDP-N-acetylmuramate dehydrogenase
MNWWKELKGKVTFLEPLSRHTTFKIGGPAKFFLEPEDYADLKLSLKAFKKHKIPFRVLGAGSNILVSDRGVKRAVLHLTSPRFKKIHFDGNHLEVGSAVMLSKLINEAAKRGLSGLEYFVGIPGTIGGALVMNAGIKEKNIADLVEYVRVMDYSGRVKSLNKREIRFGYRKSSLAKYIILGAKLKLSRVRKKEIKNKINKYLNYRKSTQDLSWPSAGCVFRNPKRYSAGQLLDLCGLKNKYIGDAHISDKHANFIVNRGRARSSDVLKLMNLAKRTVKNKFNINLEPEIRIWL